MMKKRSNFNIGDKVRVKDLTFYSSIKNLVGYVVETSNISNNVFCCVEFDHMVDGGHDCRGLSKDGHGRIIATNSIELVELVVIDEYEEWED